MQLLTFPVISIWQPWASLIASGHKWMETRTWTPRTVRPGDILAIHAAKHWTADERDLCQNAPLYYRALRDAERRGLWSFEEPPLGCVVALARLERSFPTEALTRLSEEERAFGNFRPGRMAWAFSEVRPIRPVEVRGRQHLFDWTLSPDELVYLEPRRLAGQ